MKIELNIQNGKDRENTVIALTHAGYKVTVEKRKSDYGIENYDYYIIVEDGKNKIKETDNG